MKDKMGLLQRFKGGISAAMLKKEIENTAALVAAIEADIAEVPDKEDRCDHCANCRFRADSLKRAVHDKFGIYFRLIPKGSGTGEGIHAGTGENVPQNAQEKHDGDENEKDN